LLVSAIAVTGALQGLHADASALGKLPAQNAVAQASTPTLTQWPWQWLSTNHSTGALLVPLQPTRYTVTFDPSGTLQVQADCNQVTGIYQQQPAATPGQPIQGLTIQLGASTLVACPPGSQDNDFLADLAAVSSYGFSGENLVLNLQIRGDRMTLAPLPPASLTETNWSAQTYKNGRGAVTTLAAGTAMTALFSADGSVSGTAGCNNYEGDYTLNGSSLSIGPIAATQMACSDAIMAQEQAFLTALQTTSQYELTSDRLTLRSADGATQAEFAPAVSPP
jgi:heat shock protein HslJ